MNTTQKPNDEGTQNEREAGKESVTKKAKAVGKKTKPVEKAKGVEKPKKDNNKKAAKVIKRSEIPGATLAILRDNEGNEENVAHDEDDENEAHDENNNENYAHNEDDETSAAHNEDSTGMPNIGPIKRRHSAQVNHEELVKRIKTAVHDTVKEELTKQTDELKSFIEDLVTKAKNELANKFSESVTSMRNDFGQININEESFTQFLSPLTSTPHNTEAASHSTIQLNMAAQQVLPTPALTVQQQIPPAAAAAVQQPHHQPPPQLITPPSQPPPIPAAANNVSRAAANPSSGVNSSINSSKWSLLRDEAGDKRPYFSYLVTCEVMPNDDLSGKCCRGSKIRQAIDVQKLMDIKELTFKYFPLKSDESLKEAWSKCIKNIDSRIRKRYPTNKN